MTFKENIIIPMSTPFQAVQGRIEVYDIQIYEQGLKTLICVRSFSIAIKTIFQDNIFRLVYNFV